MNHDMVLQMDAEIVQFLATYGHFPVIAKQVDQRIQEAEERLSNRLRRMQIGLESKFIQALREKGYITGNRSEQLAIINQILDEPFQDMAEVIANDGQEAAEIGRQLTFADMIEQGLGLQFTSFNESVAEQLRNRVYTFSVDTLERIKGDFAETLTTAYEEGVGIDEAALRIRADFSDLRDYRLRAIARTEIQGAQNEGINQTMQEFNVQYKQWLTVGDSRVRGNDPNDKADHVSLHGEVVRRDETFSNGLMHPLDRSRGRIEDWINCRCRARPYIPRRNEHILSTPYYP